MRAGSCDTSPCTCTGCDVSALDHASFFQGSPAGSTLTAYGPDLNGCVGTSCANCCGEYLETPDVDGAQYYFDVDTGDALSAVTRPHVFLVVRLDAADIADDPKASFFRAPPHTATNGLGSYCSPPGVAACTTTTTNWRGATFPITVSDDLGAYPIGPAYVDPAKGWDDWVVIEYGYSDANEGLLRVDGRDAAIGDGPTPFTAYRVGNMPYDDQHRTKTDVGEVLVYDADALSDTEALEVAAHLTRKWMTRPCDATGAIANGGAGDCTTSLAEGESCSPSCDECFVLSGARTCGVGDVLTDTAQCVSTCPSSCCAAKMVEMGLSVPTCCAA